MANDEKQLRIKIDGMTCIQCQIRIEKKLRNLFGVQSVEVDYVSGIAKVAYKPGVITVGEIYTCIEKLGYEVSQDYQAPVEGATRVVAILLIIVAAYLLLQRFGILNLLAPGKLAETDMSYPMLFVIGLITSVHCIAMCGGINLTQSLPKTTVSTAADSGADSNPKKRSLASFMPSVFYNSGRVISYTVIGFIVGALGSVINFSNTLQGILKLVAGIFMIIMGLNMLGFLPFLRKIVPRMPKIFSNKVEEEKRAGKSPLIVGLLNGLMPCGPLQAMQLYALSTGSPIKGALSMFLFSIGTVPLMFGLGAFVTALGKKAAKKVMTVGAALVVILGLSMLSQGVSLAGFRLPSFLNYATSANAASSENAKEATVEEGVQVVESDLQKRAYPTIIVQKGIPVKWILNAEASNITGCNSSFYIPQYNISQTIKAGENVITFEPTETGTFQYSCWMGMITGYIKVVESQEEVIEEREVQEEAAANAVTEPTPSGIPISTEEMAVAEISDDGTQKVSITLTENGFEPAIVVVQAELDVAWTINNISTRSVDVGLLAPAYQTGLPLSQGENEYYLYPTFDFVFSNSDSTGFGYVAVVEDLATADIDAIKESAAAAETLIYPVEYYTSGQSCCAE
ncbi:MAG: sulfite exporter TauE/SafE family protein [Lachnospiraceae bacterium]|jgi:sulfite exporter TauE/SafE/copper chaperone CopZ|nr:sulfite exporter TauE/SafE family protein [Lachnospiraceae bacterium]